MAKEVKISIEELRKLGEDPGNRVCIGRITKSPNDPCVTVDLCSHVELCKNIAEQL